MKRVTIMRGLPAAGKTTWAKDNRKDAIMVSADLLRIVDGVHISDPKTDPAIHNKVFSQYLELLLQGEEDIVSDHTNIYAYQISPYYKLAEIFNYDVEIIYIVTPLEVCLTRHTHRVTDQRMLEMSVGLATEVLPDYWNIKIIRGTW